MNVNKDVSVNNKKEKLARFGIGTKGFVYILLGGLSAMTAFNIGGGKKTGSSGALSFLADNTFGNILLVLTIIGLLCYIAWRMYQTFVNPEDKSVGSRIGYFSSGVFYGLLVFSGIKILIGKSSGGGNGKESFAETLLNQSYGQILVGVVAAILLGKAIYQLYRAYSGKFKEKVKEAGLDEKARKAVVNAGRVGYTARGIVVATLAFLMFRAAMSANSDKAGGTKEAFKFLQESFGTAIFAAIALGLVAYGIFMFVKAKQRKMILD